MLTNASLSERDLKVLWHPCTQMKDHESLPMIPIQSGKGIWLQDFDGNRYIDAISSWWVNLFGHGRPEIASAICQQANTLEHVLLAGFTHEPAIQLAERLVNITPNGLERCFYADNGSSGIEVALKMSFHYWKNRGHSDRKTFITLENSYHGETLGALAVGNVPLYKETYGPLLMDVITAPSPDCFHREEGESWKDFSLRQLEPLRQLLDKHAESCCAIVIEPLVQCAGNMRMYHPAYLCGLRQLCNQYKVHFIADEIAVGFGRTGTLFACEQADVSPDFMCLSKGLTGGFLPLCAVLTTDDIYQAFYDDYQNLTAFLHSHSYTGNPLACRAALATLDLFEQEKPLEFNRLRAQWMAEGVATLTDHPHVAEIRQTGMILAIEMILDKKKKTSYPWQQRKGLQVYRHGLEKGVLLRPLGNVVYFMPPYVINRDEINTMTRAAVEAVHLATGKD